MIDNANLPKVFLLFHLAPDIPIRCIATLFRAGSDTDDTAWRAKALDFPDYRLIQRQGYKTSCVSSVDAAFGRVAPEAMHLLLRTIVGPCASCACSG